MPSVYGTLSLWARKTTSFAELLVSRGEREEPAAAPAKTGELIYRLKQWPQLPDGMKTAAVYRALSMMSHRPVNRRWIMKNSRLKEKQVDQLLQRLVDDDVVEVIDSSQFRDDPN